MKKVILLAAFAISLITHLHGKPTTEELKTALDSDTFFKIVIKLQENQELFEKFQQAYRQQKQRANQE